LRWIVPDSDALDPSAAADAIRTAQGWDLALRARTRGMAWMAWALVAAGTFATYAGAEAIRLGAWMSVLWLPWAALGFLFTSLLWSSVGMASGGPRGPRSALVLHCAVFLVAAVGAAAAVVVGHVPVDPATAVLFALGVVTTSLGIFGPHRSVSSGVAQLAVGLALAGSAIWQAWAAADGSGLGRSATALVDAGLAGLGFFTVGLVLYTRR